MSESDARRSIFRGHDVSAVIDAIGNSPVLIAPSHVWLLTAIAVGLGLLTDLLFNGAPVGINAPLWLLAMIGTLIFGSRSLGLRQDGATLVLLGTSLLFASLLMWRDSSALRLMNVGGSLGLLILAVGRPAGVGLTRLSPLTIITAMYSGLVSLVSGWWRLGSRLPWQVTPAHRSEAVTVGRALLVSAPLFLTFGGLFFAADAVFAAEVKEAMRFDLQAFRSHLLWIGGGAWLAASILWSGLAIPAPPSLVADLPETRRIKALETAIVLGPLALLFALFVVVQIKYLFGGEDAVQRSISLTYAQYARHGFFELIVVSLLLLPVLTGINWARKRDRRGGIVFGTLAAALVALLFVVMASAWQRLSIYMDAFGLTELRFYSVSLLPWLAVAFVLLLGCAALGRSDRFFAGVALAAVVWLFALSIVSPDAVIARANLGRLDSGRGFDALYTTGLSADAVPSLMARLERIDESERCFVAEVLTDRWHDRSDDLRGWNWSRWQAHRRVARHTRQLLEACTSAHKVPDQLTGFL